MTELDSVAQQNSAASQETSTSAEALKEQVLSVHAMVAKLNEIVTGESKGAPAAPPSNVVAMKKKPAPKKHASVASHSYKKAAGFDVPTSDDPGFAE